ncbi:unnamed protein product [Chondrus crispus]|uniref:Uncharacterized protein n=1 Tax=Chondrus crispus TaxID=2769 RepID=R7QPX7_CHOCR|nr:unnamed protein product [Chondrus crispus]CDF40169.1 unnamed protein product [Chondrus crispus]|eukprot:XP_005710464.1 unnamed protein product [Chondrus crispus]
MEEPCRAPGEEPRAPGKGLGTGAGEGEREEGKGREKDGKRRWGDGGLSKNTSGKKGGEGGGGERERVVGVKVEEVAFGGGACRARRRSWRVGRWSLGGKSGRRRRDFDSALTVMKRCKCTAFCRWKPHTVPRPKRPISHLCVRRHASGQWHLYQKL